MDGPFREAQVKQIAGYWLVFSALLETDSSAVSVIGQGKTREEEN